jgi:hypothetical protein
VPSVAIADYCDEAHKTSHSEDNSSNSGRSAQRHLAGGNTHSRAPVLGKAIRVGRAKKHEIYNSVVPLASLIQSFLSRPWLGKAICLAEPRFHVCKINSSRSTYLIGFVEDEFK